MSLTAVSLFSGIGGLDLAAERAGFTVTDAYERNPFCCRVLRARFPHTRVHQGDIDDVHTLPNADVVFGGPPCQGWSSAGNGLGVKDHRNKWPEMYRLVCQSRPRFVVIENVRGGIAKGILSYIQSDLESAGYKAWTFVYPAALVGAPHLRYRLFLLAYRQSPRLEARGQAEGAGSFARSGASRLLGDPESVGQSHQPKVERAQRAGFPVRPVKHQQRKLPQPGLVRAADGLPGRLDFPGFPAYFGQEQHDYEPSRTVVSPGAHHRPRIQGLGNAVVPDHVLPLFIALHRFLSEVVA